MRTCHSCPIGARQQEQPNADVTKDVSPSYLSCNKHVPTYELFRELFNATTDRILNRSKGGMIDAYPFPKSTERQGNPEELWDIEARLLIDTRNHLSTLVHSAAHTDSH